MPAMEARRIVLHPRTREKLRRAAGRCKDADARVRYLVVPRSADGWSGKRITKAPGCCAATAGRTPDRWEGYGEAGPVDRRGDDGAAEADGPYAETVLWILPVLAGVADRPVQNPTQALLESIDKLPDCDLPSVQFRGRLLAAAHELTPRGIRLVEHEEEVPRLVGPRRTEQCSVHAEAVAEFRREALQQQKFSGHNQVDESIVLSLLSQARANRRMPVSSERCRRTARRSNFSQNRRKAVPSSAPR
jgi:hypothetical protein